MGLRGITLFRLMVHHLLYYWRTNCIIVSGVILISLTLTGALLIGDSLRATLHRIADGRLGRTEYVITSYSKKLFTERLFDSFNKRIPNAGAPILLKQGSLSTDGGRQRVLLP